MFVEDDTEEMNFNIAYNSFVLGRDEWTTKITNDDSSINHLRELAKKVFISKNTSVIVFGNCKRITKKQVGTIIAEFDQYEEE